MRSDRKKLFREIIASFSRVRVQAAFTIILFCCIVVGGGYVVFHLHREQSSAIVPRGGEAAHVVPSSFPQKQNRTSSINDAEVLTLIEDASSEKSGKWFGLCKKRSIHSLEDFRRTVENDPVLTVYYAGFNWEEARLGNLKEDVMAYVAHRKGEVIRQTAKPIKLPRGDGYVTDGVRTARTYCCNDIVLTPSAGPPPAAPVPPSAETPGLPPKQHQVLPPPLSTRSGPGLTGLTSSSFYYAHRRPPAPVPEPDTVFLMSIGLLFLAVTHRKK